MNKQQAERFNEEDVASSWSDFATTWWQQEGEEGDFYHANFIVPSVLALLGDVQAKHVLDMACGTGTVSRRLARKGAQVTGIDISAGMLAKAAEVEQKEPLGIEYRCMSASNLDGLPEGSFDAVVCNMALMDIRDLHGAMLEARRILAPRGQFVFSILHPCFCTPGSGWVKTDSSSKRNQDKLYWKVDHYFERRAGRDASPFSQDGGPIYFHRTLGDYLNGLLGLGFRITAVDEPEPAGALAERCADMTRMAEFLVVAARKEDG